MSDTGKQKDPSIRIVFFGDSICVGQGISIHKGWVPRIAASIEEFARKNDRELVVVNASINGNTTRQALERMAYDVQSNGADIMLVQFGLNDCNFWMTDKGLPRVSPKAFAANLDEIIRRGQRFGAQTVLLNTNHPTTRDQEIMANTDVTYEQHNRHYNEIIREVAANSEGNVVLNDIEKAVLECTGNSRERIAETLLADQLHLSLKGHDIYYDVMQPRLHAALKAAIAA